MASKGRRMALVVLACTSAMALTCGDDNGDDGVPSAVTTVRVVDGVRAITVDASTTVDSIRVATVSVGGIAAGLLGGYDTTEYYEVVPVGGVVDLALGGVTVYFRRCAGAACTPDSVSVASLGPFVVEVAADTQNTIVVDTSMVPVRNLVQQQTEIRVDNRMSNIVLSGGGTVDSVHAYGVRVGSVALGTVRAGALSAYAATVQSGAVNLSVDSLVVVRATGNQTLRSVASIPVTIAANVRNTYTLNAASYPLEQLLGGSPGSVSVRFRCAIASCSIGQDSVEAVDLYGIQAGGVAFGNLTSGQASQVRSVAAVNGRVTVRIDSLYSSQWDCITPTVCVPQTWIYACVDTFSVAVAATGTTTIDFSCSSTYTQQLWTNKRTTCQ